MFLSRFFQRWTLLTTSKCVPNYAKNFKIHDTSFYENVTINPTNPDNIELSNGTANGIVGPTNPDNIELGNGTLAKPVWTAEKGTNT